MAKTRSRTGMATSVPYGKEIYELTGIEFCELEDLLDAVPDADDVAYERVVYKFLSDKGYDAPPPAAHGINIGGIPLRSTLTPPMTSKRAVDALHANARAACGNVRDANRDENNAREVPRRRIESGARRRRARIIRQFIEEGRHIKVKREAPVLHFGVYVIAGYLVYLLIGAIWASPVSSVPTPVPSPRPIILPIRTTPIKIDSTASGAQETPNRVKGITPKKPTAPKVGVRLQQPSASAPPLSPPAPLTRDGLQKKGARILELLKPSKPEDFY